MTAIVNNRHLEEQLLVVSFLCQVENLLTIKFLRNIRSSNEEPYFFRLIYEFLYLFITIHFLQHRHRSLTFDKQKNICVIFCGRKYFVDLIYINGWK